MEAHKHNESNHKEEKISTPDVKKSNLFKILVFIFLSIVILISITKIINKVKREKVDDTKTEIVKKPEVETIPNIYTEYHLLKKGELIRVNVPSGYSYTCSGGGKKYYHQAQNTSCPELWGDRKYHDSGEHIAYFYLIYYDEEITVACEFKKLY